MLLFQFIVFYYFIDVWEVTSNISVPLVLRASMLMHYKEIELMTNLISNYSSGNAMNSNFKNRGKAVIAP